MKYLFAVFCFAFLLTACDKSTEAEIYNENNTTVINGVVYDIDENPINGIYKTYYSNGSVKMEMAAVKGLPNGEGRFYDENGNLQYSGTFENGKINGKFYQYYEDGNIHNELNYVNGEQQGSQFLYDNKGSLLAEVIYENGKAVSGYVMIDGEKTELESDYLDDLAIAETLEEGMKNFQEEPNEDVD